MASEVLCGRCGAPLSNLAAPCPRCGTAASASAAASSAAHGYYAPPYGALYRRKNPMLAAALAVVPGLGHFYLGQNLKGAGFLVAIGGFQFFGFDLDLSVIGAAIGVPMELGGGTLWLFSIVDAYRTAKHMNAAAGYQ